MRNRRRDLNDAITVRHFAHRRNDSVADRAFELQRIADDEDRFAFVRQFSRKLAAARTFERHIDAQQREIAFFVDGNRAADGKNFSFAIERLDLSACSAANDVQVRNDLSGRRKKPLPVINASPFAS